MTRDASSQKHLWVIGHRGAPDREIENTIESFERALDGANGLELDVCVTREVVVWHDEDPHAWRARFRRLGLEPVVRYRPLAHWIVTVQVTVLSE